MWWVEQAERGTERERQKKLREKCARRAVDRRLKDYCTALVGESVPCAETLLDRAAERRLRGTRNEPMRRICPNCAQVMAVVRRTRDLRATCAIFDFECESCGVGYTEAEEIEKERRHRRSVLMPLFDVTF